MMIGMIALWALLIWGAFYLATHVVQRDTVQRRSALELLEQRYVRGEIDRVELEVGRRALQGE
jgi:uncharacterized membrane protein